MATLDSTYDFIVCGGGTSGCVVAARLAEDANAKVLVIEAGQHNENLENVHMVGGWSQNFDKETDWNVVSTQGPGVNDRQVKLSRGKFLGGCSGVNGTLVIKGMKQDYDDWDLSGWSGQDFFKYMAKAENFHNKDWFNETKGSHGREGHVHTEPHDLAPISNLIKDSMVSKGLSLDHDMFATGENPHGCGHPVRTVYNGVRSTGADFITKQEPRDNLHLMVETHVDKVVIEQDGHGELKATGVWAVQADGTVVQLKARKEVIVSGGAYCSPNILNRSGIGAKDELDKHGIATLVDLPGVGKNLQDHLIVFMFYETEKEGITHDHLVYHNDGLAKSYALWKEEKKGFLSSFPFGIFAYARIDERLADSEMWNSAPRKEGRDPMGLTWKQPQIELFSTECYGGPKHYDQFPINGKHAFSMIADCSIMPTVNNGHTQMPAYGIGEKAADLIKETWAFTGVKL
ncbi:hypothetical protein F66182_1780 [Fusarium sp. NRRL 66182]|nr:hypothetical protein F66182_1780 [Fusarium sp. NRRL 66182]